MNIFNANLTRVVMSFGTSFFLILIVTCNYIYSQSYSSKVTAIDGGIRVDLTFDNEKITSAIKNNLTEIDFNDFINESEPGSPKLPSKIIYAAIPPGAEVIIDVSIKKSEIISNSVPSANPYSELINDSLLVTKPAELNEELFVDEIFPANDVELLGYVWIRDYYCVVIKINTHRYMWKQREIHINKSAEIKLSFKNVPPYSRNYGPTAAFDKILEDIIVNYHTASEFRSVRPFDPAADTTGNWINYSNEYVKLAIINDGIHRITYNDFIGYGGNPSSIDPKTFKIFHRGNEVPLFVRGEEDGIFDPDDVIEFWMEKNYTPFDYRTIVSFGQDYINYMDRYNDTTFVFLTWDFQSGLRADSVSSVVPGIQDTIDSHMARIHLERDIRLWYYDAATPRIQLPFWQENKVWTWETIGSSGNRSFTFTARNRVPSTVVEITSRLISNAGEINFNTHKYGSSLNSTTIQDSIIFNYRETKNFTSYFSSNVLNEGNNTYRVFGLPTQAVLQRSLIDWVDVNYFRFNAAVNDSVKIVIPDSVTMGIRVIKATGFSSSDNLVLYKVKPYLKKILSYNYSGGVITFTDTVSGGDVYALSKNQHVYQPRFVNKKQFVNLRDPGRAADYIIISHHSLQQSASAYGSYIASEYGERVQTIYIDDIYDEFGFGSNAPESIKDFLKYAYSQWQSPAPSYVNIIGDANYDYKRVVNPPGGITRKNLVPSYGQPVSDVWFTTFDSTAVNIPQMHIGRIPAATNDQVNFYLQKHMAYKNRQFDEWNKYFLFFSGGEIGDPGQLNQIRQANQNLFDNLVKPAPVGGRGTHFYKTIDPPTNFGPYTPAEVGEAIGRGGLFISYIGHSGTQTWDNGILSTSDLKNNYSDRSSLISDFGCSTGKFAEPDVDCFGELFVLEQPDGQAISYLGNSSLGFLSTSLRFPSIFYSQFLIDSVLSMGEAHLKAKIKQYTDFGYSDVNRVFGYCNLLFGDPIVEFKNPYKPNFVASSANFSLGGVVPNDLMDTVTVNYQVYNWGRVPSDSLDILVSHTWQDTVRYELQLRIPAPLFSDEVVFNIPVLRRVGSHTVTVNLDNFNTVDEIYEDDNIASFTFTVYSSSVRPVETEKYYSTGRQKINLLNPTLKLLNAPEEIMFSIADNPSFNNPLQMILPFDTLLTRIDLSSLNSDQRYWWRARINEPSLEWTETFSFTNIFAGFNWFIDKNFRDADLSYENTSFDSSSLSWSLSSFTNTLKVGSAGSDDGEYGSMLFNNQEVMPTTFYWGIATAIINPVTLQPSEFKYFLYWDPSPADSMNAYLQSLPEGTMVGFTICADGHQAVLSRVNNALLRATIRNFGSTFVDSVRYRDSWSFIGKKGTPQGPVLESFKKRYTGPAMIDTLVNVNNSAGSVLFPLISDASGWSYIIKYDSIPDGANISYLPVVFNNENQPDTLASLVFIGDSASINHIDASLYQKLKMLTVFESNLNFESPKLYSFGIKYSGLPELAINYQVVTTERDTIYEGDSLKLSFGVYNAGEVNADSVGVLISLIKPDNSTRVLSDSLYSLTANSRKTINHTYYHVQSDGKGRMRFRIEIDPLSNIREIYDDNNNYDLEFFIKEDSSVTSVNPATVSALFDGIEIFDGEFVSSNPEISVVLNYPSWFPFSDTSAVEFRVDNIKIPYASFDITFDTINRRIIYITQPELSDGEHIFSIYGENVYGRLENTPGYTRLFTVSNELKLMEVFNYPNPFNDGTHFTFKLTQIPDEMYIKIYTVAGRLIKNINIIPSQLNHDFNRIHWDGRDNDGDLVANGVYFYKVIVKRGDKTENITQKLAIVR